MPAIESPSPEPAVNLRLATHADIPAMRRVRMAVRENVLSDPSRVTEADYIAALKALGRSWVIEVDGEIVAFASAHDAGSIWALFVHPDHEGRGHGKALHRAMCQWLWSRGHSRLWLTTGAGTRAEHFYIAQGWRSCGEVAGGEVRLECDHPQRTGDG